MTRFSARRLFHRRTLAAAGALALPMLGAGCDQRAAGPASAPEVGYTLLDGKPAHLSDLRGRVVLVNFWATWCGPCKVEMPHLNRLYEKYRAAGFELLGVNIDDDPKAAVALATRMGLKFPVLLDTDKSVTRRYALDSMPGTVLIDRDGKVRHVHKGYREGVEATYDAQIRALVKE